MDGKLSLIALALIGICVIATPCSAFAIMTTSELEKFCYNTYATDGKLCRQQMAHRSDTLIIGDSLTSAQVKQLVEQFVADKLNLRACGKQK